MDLGQKYERQKRVQQSSLFLFLPLFFRMCMGIEQERVWGETVNGCGLHQFNRTDCRVGDEFVWNCFSKCLR